MLVGVGCVVLLGEEVAEEDVGQRLVTVRMQTRHVDRDGVVVTDVLGERLPGRQVQDDDAHHSRETDEDVVLAELVVVEPAHDAAPRVREVDLPDRLRQRARARELAKPAALVVMPRER